MAAETTLLELEEVSLVGSCGNVSTGTVGSRPFVAAATLRWLLVPFTRRGDAGQSKASDTAAGQLANPESQQGDGQHAQPEPQQNRREHGVWGQGVGGQGGGQQSGGQQSRGQREMVGGAEVSWGKRLSLAASAAVSRLESMRALPLAARRALFVALNSPSIRLRPAALNPHVGNMGPHVASDGQPFGRVEGILNQEQGPGMGERVPAVDPALLQHMQETAEPVMASSPQQQQGSLGQGEGANRWGARPALAPVLYPAGRWLYISEAAVEVGCNNTGQGAAQGSHIAGQQVPAGSALTLLEVPQGAFFFDRVVLTREALQHHRGRSYRAAVQELLNRPKI